MSANPPIVFRNEEAEAACLGAALTNEGACRLVCRDLPVGDLYGDKNRRVLAAIRKLQEGGRPVDAISVGAELGDDGEYPFVLADSTLTASHAAEYIAAVRDCARRRRLHLAAENAQLALSQANGEGVRRFRETISAALEAEPIESRRLRAITAPELAGMTTEHVEYVVWGYLARGNITQLAAAIKVGKTRFALDAISSMLGGRDFIGHATECCPVLYLTEQGLVSFRVALDRTGLLHCPDLHVLLRNAARGADWPEVGEMVSAYIAEHSIGLVVVDTLSDWAGLAREAEKDEGAARETVKVMRPWADAGCAVLAIQHDRKGGGQIGESARGSTAFGGSMDILVTLRRDEKDGNKNRRTLGIVTRLDEELQDAVIELDGEHYRMIGEVGATKRLLAERAIVDCLPREIGQAIDMATICEATSATRSTVQRVLNVLRANGVVSIAKVHRLDGHGMRDVYWIGEAE